MVDSENTPPEPQHNISLLRELSDALYHLNTALIELGSTVIMEAYFYEVTPCGRQNNLKAVVKKFTGFEAITKAAAAYQSTAIGDEFGFGTRTKSYPGILIYPYKTLSTIIPLVQLVNDTKAKIASSHCRNGVNFSKLKQSTEDSTTSLLMLTRQIPIATLKNGGRIACSWKSRSGMRMLTPKNIETRLAKALAHNEITNEKMLTYTSLHKRLIASHVFRVRRNITPHPVFNITCTDNGRSQLLGQLPLLVFSEVKVSVKHLANYNHLKQKARRRNTVTKEDLIFPEIGVYATPKL